jgi:DNA-binding response OmpR family regulator
MREMTWPDLAVEKTLAEKWEEVKSRSSLLRAGSEWLHRTLPARTQEQRDAHRQLIETTEVGKRHFLAMLNDPSIQQETPEATRRSVRHHLLFSEIRESAYKKLEIIRRAVDHLVSIEPASLSWPEACALLLVGKLLTGSPAGERLPKPLRELNPILPSLQSRRVRDAILTLLAHETDSATKRTKLLLFAERLHGLLELWPDLVACREYTHRYGPLRIDPKRHRVRVGLTAIAPCLSAHQRILAILALAEGRPVSRGELARKAMYARKRLSDPNDRAHRRLRTAIHTLNLFLAEHCIRLRITTATKGFYKLTRLDKINRYFIPNGPFLDIGKPIICSHGSTASCEWRRYGDISFIVPPETGIQPVPGRAHDYLATTRSP